MPPQDVEDACDAAASVHHLETMVLGEPQELRQEVGLVYLEAAKDVLLSEEVETGLPEVESARQHAREQVFHVHVEIDRAVWDQCESVELFHPLPGNASNGGSRDQREDVTVHQRHHARSQRRDDLPLQAIPEVRGVEEVQRNRVERVALLRPLDAGPGELGADETSVEHS